MKMSDKYSNVLISCCYSIFLITFFSVAGNAFANENTAVGHDKILTLNDCITIISANSDELDYAESEVAVQKQNHLSAQKDLYPTLNSSYSYKKKKPSSLVNENTYTYNVSLEQPLYKGRSLVTAVDVAKFNEEVAKSTYDETFNNLLLSLYGSYYDLLKAQKIEQEADLAVVRLQSHLKDAQAFYDVGLIPKNDLLLSEVELAEGLQDQLTAQNDKLLAGSVLNLLLNKPVDQSIQIQDIQEIYPRSISWDDVLSKALSLRPELAQLKINSQSSEKNIQLAKANYLPSVSLTATYQKTGDDILAKSYPLGPSESQTAMAVASWRFWSWGQNGNKIAAARKELLKSKKLVSMLIDSITLETREAYLNVMDAEKKIDVTKKAVVQAEENFRINEARYKSQLATSTDVLDAQTLLSRANTNYYSSLYNYQKALATLDWASGTLRHSNL